MPKVLKAFTLLELMITVGIIAIMTGALIPSFSIYLKNQNVKQAQEQIKSDLRTAQNKALTGTASDTGAVYWGIYFQANQSNYTFFTSTVNDTCPPAMTNTTTSDTIYGSVITKNAGNECAFFSLANGDATYFSGSLNTSCSLITGNCNLPLGYSDTSTNCFGVGINSAGLIKNLSGLLCN